MNLHAGSIGAAILCVIALVTAGAPLEALYLVLAGTIVVVKSRSP
jgi:hypothetical protein